jgi:hypothetical protein
MSSDTLSTRPASIQHPFVAFAGEKAIVCFEECGCSSAPARYTNTLTGMRTSHIVGFQLFGEQMDYRDKIISDIAEAECKHICRKVILALQRMTEGMQTGDDTPLKNIWDEVCVEVQFYQSVFWDLYLYTIGTTIWAAVERLDVPRKQAIWLQTGAGMDWAVENEDQQVPVDCERDIIDYIQNSFVLSEAADWTNERIEKHIASMALD